MLTHLLYAAAGMTLIAFLLSLSTCILPPVIYFANEFILSLHCELFLSSHAIHYYFMIVAEGLESWPAHIVSGCFVSSSREVLFICYVILMAYETSEFPES